MLDGIRPNTVLPPFLAGFDQCHVGAQPRLPASRATGAAFFAEIVLRTISDRSLPLWHARSDHRCQDCRFPALRLRAGRSRLTICHWQIVRAAPTPLPAGLSPPAIGPQKRSTGAFPVGPLRAQYVQCRHWRSPESCPMIAPCPHRYSASASTHVIVCQ